MSKREPAAAPLQRRLSFACEEASKQIKLAMELCGEYREADVADLIYAFMRDIIHECAEARPAVSPSVQPFCSCEAGSDGDCDVHGPAVSPQGPSEKCGAYLSVHVGAIGKPLYCNLAKGHEGSCGHLAAALAAPSVPPFTIQQAIEIVASEPELPGPMPEYMRKELLRHSIEDQQRTAVIATKRSIIRNLQKLAAESEAARKDKP